MHDKPLSRSFYLPESPLNTAPRRLARDRNRRQPPSPLSPARRPAGDHPVPPVRRHRIGKEMPAVIHPGPDPAAINLCRDLAAQTDVEAVVLFGSRATGGWDERSDLDVIIVHPSAAGREAETATRRVLRRIRERHYPGCWDHESSHRGARGGQQVVSLDYYASYRRTMNDVMARAAREGRIFTREPNAADRFRHDGNVSNEWELVTLERLNRAVHILQNIVFMQG